MKQNKKETIIFVYGTLMRGFGNHRLLEGQKYIGEGLTNQEYTLVDVGNFPGMFDNGDTAVLGEIYKIDSDVQVQLDYLEGAIPSAPETGLYRREKITLSCGTRVTTYLFNETAFNKERYFIDSGSWKQHVTQGKRTL